MCFHDSPIKVSSLSYEFSYSLTEVYPGPPFGSTRTDDFTADISVSLTRVYLADKGLPIGLDSIEGVSDSLNPGEFFLLSDCCCPCNWTFIPKFQDQYDSVATQTRSVPDDGLFGTVTFACTLSFTIVPNRLQYTICGRNVTYDAQSIYWPSFDGVTPNDPAYFDNGIALVFVCTGYTGSPVLDPGIGSGYSGGSLVSPYQPTLGYFLFYDNSGPPPAPIPGVTGSGNGFRQPCDVDMNFSQSATWSMSYPPNSLTGNGSGSILVQFVT